MLQKHVLTLATALLITTSMLGSEALAAKSYFKGAALKQLITGKTVRLENPGGKIKYRRDGTYRYTDVRGQRSNGTYSFTNSKVCVLFEQGIRRCDRYLKEGDETYFHSGVTGRLLEVKSIR